MGVIGRMLLLLLALSSMTACRDDLDLPVAEWTLAVEGEPEAIPVHLPTHLDAHLPRDNTRYVLRAQVDPGPLRGQALRLVIPHFEGITELLVNGERALPVQYEPIEIYRHAGPHVWDLPEASSVAPTLRLVLTVDHRWTQSGWLGTVPQLRRRGRLGGHALAVLVVNDFTAVATLASLLLIGIMSLGVYRADRSVDSYLWFSVQLLSASYYPLHVSGYSQVLVGPYDTLVVVLLLDLALYAAVRFTEAEFGTNEPSRIRPWTVGLAVTWLAALVTFDPFWIGVIGGRATVLYMGAVFTYQVWTGISLVRRTERPRGAVLFLSSWVALALTAAFDGIAWLGLGEPLGGVRGGCVGLGTFALISALRLTREHIHSIMTTDHLNRQLERRVDALEIKRGEIEELNVRLRDQMSHRSRQLFALLSQLPNAGVNPRLQLMPGDVINGRYRVTHELGAGGMGVVYAVLRLADEMPLALKITVQGDAWGLARLAREAEIAMLVDHPNVVAVTDVDIDPRRGFLYMVMEHVDGPSLAEHKQGFGQDQDWALDVLRQLASGLAALHTAGVVHRDLKPANILLVMNDADEGPRVKLTDFGISRTLEPSGDPSETRPEDSDVMMPVVRSKALDPATRRLLDAEVRGQAAAASLAQHEQLVPRPRRVQDPAAAHDESTRELRVDEVKELELWEPSSPLTQAGCIVGTPVFMAPELGLDPPVISAAADIFSFGVLAHQLLTGRRPFTEPPVMAVAEGRPPPEPQLALKALPGPLHAPLRACLSFDSGSRPSAARLAEVVEALIARRRAGLSAGLSAGLPAGLSAGLPAGLPAEMVEVGEHRVRAKDPDAPRPREHETSPPEPHAA
ncbi:MAG: protein kinase [Myxococcota bacterium]